MQQVTEFQAILLKWNKKINLIARSTEADVEALHIDDGILGSEIILKDKPFKHVFDLGTGNGIPGVLYAILDPETNVTCVDSDERKISFLKYVKLQLGLKNLEPICMRVEDVDYGSNVTFISRGFASIAETLHMIERKVRVPASFYFFKADGWENETKGSTWNISKLGEYQLTLKSGKKISRNIIRAKLEPARR